MVEEFRLKKIGDSRHLRIPHEFIRVHKLDKYVYHFDVSKDGKTIMFKRMRKDEKLEE